ncbi:cyclin-dependent kinase inhibitor 3 family protein [Roseomonas haemaphysalidis]|uniref:protein-tyrosine-phosphatase n=1 Tax=Roseomonas haemaphysalidis TaxID=2768162 RepID=A0ABS3KW40_9PROT|nr:cyclin-dependent kinase inhibitor 3 family protein [Roseomonas haemaphysalidis]MBO1081674.1 cyclin-dependent kinase inhibitor 3 family protein [Roseomonas haemaphysalidis]
MRTSHTHPLQIAAVSCPNGGTLGITFCPGKWQAAAATGAWSRDLAVDIEAIRAWGATSVLTLVTSEELHALRVPNLGHAFAQAGIGWHHLPIEDVSTPTPAWEASWLAVWEAVHAALDSSARVLVHCKGGLGRAGLVSACILIERGLAPRAAIAAIRAVRPGAVETPEQERYVLRIARNLAGKE